MSAPNFSYSRRCVLVRNEDFERGNVPAHNECFDDSLGYPSAYLDKYKDDFSTIAIVLTSGYYMDACIDIVDREDKTNELIGYADYYSNHTRKELLDDVCYFLGCSRKFANKFFKGLRRNDYHYGRELEEAFDTLVEEWRDVEVEKANKVLDEIKKDYGYKELGLSAMFSNGEAFYNYI